MSDDYMKTLEIQRRLFEAQFGRLEAMGYRDSTHKAGDSDSEDNSDDIKSNNDEVSSEQGEEEEDFCGFDSDLDDDRTAQISHVTPKIDSIVKPKIVLLIESFTPTPPVKTNRRLTRFGRVPTIQEQEEKQRQLLKLLKRQQQQAAKEDSENLKNDLKLQRLLNYEAPIGNARRRILDQRIRAAAAVNSGTQGLPKKLEKMPMSMRKGMIRARDQRVAEYEHKSREAGIILSRVKKGEVRTLDYGRGATLASDRLGVGNKQGNKIRDRGLKIQSVGKSTRNGLRLSQLEIDHVNNLGQRRRK